VGVRAPPPPAEDVVHPRVDDVGHGILVPSVVVERHGYNS
jgi:hypothetical protein